MKNYVEGSLKVGINSPSSSAAGACFFFVAKKDSSLRSCIDYWGLKGIKVNNRYLLIDCICPDSRCEDFNRARPKNAYGDE